jgi:hypothetical protein
MHLASIGALTIGSRYRSSRCLRGLNTGPEIAGLAVVFLMAIIHPALAGPWLDPGDGALRHDLQLLADGGVVPIPITQWPISWGDIDLDDVRLGQLSPAEVAAFGRLTARLRREREEGLHVALATSVGGEGIALRSFQDTPREQLELGVGVDWLGKRFAFRGRAQYVYDAEDDREFRLDDSYAAMALGNWMFSVAASDRWWGPSWQGSLFLSNNARPIPAITIDRNLTSPFESKWLSWIGRWDLVALFGFLESERAVPDAQFFGLRVTFKPARWLEVGLSRTATWCGEDRPCGLDTFGDLLLGRDNAGDNVAAEDEPGNQIAGYDIRLTGAGFGLPVAIYAQRAGEDEQNFRPALFMTQIGLEYWGGLPNGIGYRTYVEVSDTLCGGNITGPGEPNVCYNHPIYRTGMRFRGRAIGFSADNDAEVVTVGGVMALNDSSWLFSITAGELNREGSPDPANTVTAVPADYLGLNLNYQRPLPLGQLRTGLGYESFDLGAAGRDEEWRGFLEWRVDW